MDERPGRQRRRVRRLVAMDAGDVPGDPAQACIGPFGETGMLTGVHLPAEHDALRRGANRTPA